MKVFGIGLNKTGTTTLGKCFTHFGYKHQSFDLGLMKHVSRGELEPVFDFVDEYDSFEDWPWPLIYEELDDHYPNSKFILTTRKDSSTWFESLRRHSERTGPTEFRKIAYGYEMPHGHESDHIEVYERHNGEVRDYFSDSNDLLEVCWETGSGWKELCNFLNETEPDIPFPHANKGDGLLKSTLRSIKDSLT